MRRLVSILALTLVGVALMALVLDEVGGVRAQAPPPAKPVSPQVETHGIIASGSALIPPHVDITATPLMMTLSLSGQGADAADAVSEVEKQARTLTLALNTVGIPSSAIQLTSLSVTSQLLPPYPAPTSPATTATPQPGTTPRRTYTARGGLRIGIAGLDQLSPATSAIASTGMIAQYEATSAPPNQPSADGLALAVDQAMQQARDMATRAASRAGLALGGVRGVEIKSPLSQPTTTPSYSGDPGGWRLEVVVTYDVVSK